MPIDPSGTNPGVTAAAPKEPDTLNLRCKNPSCDSIQAIEIKMANTPSVRMYECVKCRIPFRITVGVAVDF